MPDKKMHKSMRISTIWLSGLVLLLTTAFATQAFAQDAAPTDPTTLNEPVDTAEILVTEPGVTFTWDEVVNAATYEFQLFYEGPVVNNTEPIPLKTKVVSDPTLFLSMDSLLTLITLDPALQNADSTFFWRVRARNANGEAPWSNNDIAWEFTLIELANNPPNFVDVAAGDTTIFVEEQLLFTVVAEDPEDDNITYSIDAASQALGMTLAADTGAFEWTPTVDQAGAYPVTFTATDDGTPVASADTTITITVIERGGGWVALPADGTELPEEALYQTTVEAADDVGSQFTYTINDEAIALGMSISADGLFFWTPIEGQGPAPYNVTFTATSSGTTPVVLDTTITLNVLEVNKAP